MLGWGTWGVLVARKIKDVTTGSSLGEVGVTLNEEFPGHPVEGSGVVLLGLAACRLPCCAPKLSHQGMK